MDRFAEVWENLRTHPTERLIRSHRRPPREWAGMKRVIALLVAVAVTGSSSTVIVPPRKAVEQPAVALPSPVHPPAPEIRVEPNKPAVKTVSNSVEYAARFKRPNTTRPLRVKPPEQSKIDKVISYALTQQGKPYRWANAGPYGFDCSGLILASFRTVGIRLPHFTGSIVRLGSAVGKASLQLGDVVFPTAGHVGIYLGNGMMVHASSSKGQVTIGKVYSFYAARRLIP